MLGIILAGGTGSRLDPLTRTVSKQLLPVFDKPMIYYALSVHMLMHTKDIVIVSTPRDTPLLATLLGDGSRFGISITYRVQPNPNGIPEVFEICSDLIKKYKNCCLILGDNMFHGQDFVSLLQAGNINNTGATIFPITSTNPGAYGVVVLDADGEISEIVEKPTKYISNWIIPGLYIFDKGVCDKVKNLSASERGELEIVDLLREYLRENSLSYSLLGRGTTWFDMGTPEQLLEASNFVAMVQRHQGKYIAHLEEITHSNSTKFTNINLKHLGNKTKYAEYLKHIKDEK